jgi:lysophospholipase L1-like esterase
MKFLLATLLMIVGCSCGKNLPTVSSECAPDNGHYLYAFGDSIVAGFDRGGYPAVIACAKGYTLVNMAVGGTSIEFGNQYAMMMAHQRNWAKGDAVIFMPGINDAILYDLDAAHVADYTTKVQTLVTMFATREADVYFGTPNTSCNEPRFGPNASKDAYAQINRDLFNAQSAPNVHFVDMNVEFAPTWTNTHDCIHPNATGNKEMAAIVLNHMN